MEKIQANRPLDGIIVLGADEISIGKGQSYLTMISALEGPRGPEMLDVVEGRKEKHLKRFWRWFGKKRAKLVTHAVIDMWRPFKPKLRKGKILICCSVANNCIKTLEKCAPSAG